MVTQRFAPTKKGEHYAFCRQSLWPVFFATLMASYSSIFGLNIETSMQFINLSFLKID
jgi:hypothetical protein